MTAIQLNLDTPIELAKSVLDIEAKSITELKGRIGENLLLALDTIIKSKGRVIVTGMGKSGHIGRKIATIAKRPTRTFDGILTICEDLFTEALRQCKYIINATYDTAATGHKTT